MKIESPEISIVKTKTRVTKKTWKVLVLDDRFVVHQATKLLLQRMSYAGRSFEVLESYSLRESKQLLKNRDDIALVIVDSEINGEENIALKIMDFIRRDLQNEKVRILLRTGYSNSFSNECITEKYYVDGCLSEEETSTSKFEFEIVGAIQTYRKILNINSYLQGFAESVAYEMRNSLIMFGLNFSAIKNELFRLEKKHPNQNTDVVSDLINKGLHLCKRSDMIVDMMFKNIKEERVDENCFEVISISRTINRTIEEFAYSNQSGKEKFELDLTQDFDFKGDEDSFVYVLFNLFKNSLFYLVNKPDGKIQIRLEKGEEVNTLYFKDNGVGIPKEKLSSIFDSFKTYGKNEGTGLGLAFCKRVMIGFGGDVVCQSDFGHWTQFVLTFPKCDKE